MRIVYPIYGTQGKMNFPWKLTKTGKIAVFALNSWGESEWFYCNPKTGWVPLPGKHAASKNTTAETATNEL